MTHRAQQQYSLTERLDGGARGLGTTRRNHTTPMSHNQEICDSLDQRRADLKEIVAAAARHALDTNTLLTPKQKEQLRDVERGRYADGLLRVLLEGLAAAANPLMLAEMLRGAQLQLVASPSLSVVDTWLDEAGKQGAADVAHNAFIVERTAVRRDVALDRLVPHREALTHAIDALLRWNPLRAAQ